MQKVAVPIVFLGVFGILFLSILKASAFFEVNVVGWKVLLVCLGSGGIATGYNVRIGRLFVEVSGREKTQVGEMAWNAIVFLLVTIIIISLLFWTKAVSGWIGMAGGAIASGIDTIRISPRGVEAR